VVVVSSGGDVGGDRSGEDDNENPSDRFVRDRLGDAVRRTLSLVRPHPPNAQFGTAPPAERSVWCGFRRISAPN
jgi:hypothetical protein